ncbi:MAG: resA 14 [Phycisphaerales bacterium]|jgi:hypothetical protein|nr:resA 14 [Phycisphaerales bacterium]
MHQYFGVSVLAVLLVVTSSLRGAPHGEAGAGEESTLAAQYEACISEYEKARKELAKSPVGAVSRMENGHLVIEEPGPPRPDPNKVFAPRFLKLAREHAGSSIAIEALGWVVAHNLFNNEAAEAMGEITQRYAADPRIAAVLRDLNGLYGERFEPLELMFRAVLKESPDRQTRGLACFGLARQLKFRRQMAEDKLRRYEMYLKSPDTGGYAVKPDVSEEPLAKADAEAAELFKRVVDEYSDIIRQPAGGTLGSAARSELAAMAYLAVGKPAPDIKGEDLLGRAMNLSDFRGKVVVLNFGNHQYCGICRANYVHYRDLIKDHAGDPFVMLGVQSGDDIQKTKAAATRGDITWRSWWDGGYGPLAVRYNIGGWPTYYILDRQGIIRHKGSMSVEELDDAIGRLLKEKQVDPPPSGTGGVK